MNRDIIFILPTFEERLQYYLGEMYYQKVKIKKEYIESILLRNLPQTSPTYDKIISIDNNKLSGIFKSQYTMDMENILKNIDIIYLICIFGDSILDIQYLISKVRKKKNIILKLNTRRHWFSFPALDGFEIPFESKRKMMVWRGSTTGFIFQRENLVLNNFEKHSHIDVAFNQIAQNKNDMLPYVKNSISIRDMLQYKFLISVEGNDVATDLKWKLYSKSLVFMRRPTVFSWLMEDKLIPYYHYIPLNDDFTDLDEKYQWALENIHKCKEIIKNANAYMSQFMDEDKEIYLQREIIRIYTENLEIV